MPGVHLVGGAVVARTACCHSPVLARLETPAGEQQLGEEDLEVQADLEVVGVYLEEEPVRLEEVALAEALSGAGCGEVTMRVLALARLGALDGPRWYGCVHTSCLPMCPPRVLA